MQVSREEQQQELEDLNGQLEENESKGKQLEEEVARLKKQLAKKEKAHQQRL